MKKLLLIISCILLIGCGYQKSATNEVRNYLNSYKDLDGSVLVQIEDEANKNEYTDKQKSVYKDILKKQYQDLSYKIEKKEKDGDITYVTVKVKVYDLYTAQNDASKYLSDHMDDFYDKNGKYDSSKYLDYKLNLMKNVTNKVEYTIVFSVEEKDGEFVVLQPSEVDLEKIHGVYNAEV